MLTSGSITSHPTFDEAVTSVVMESALDAVGIGAVAVDVAAVVLL